MTSPKVLYKKKIISKLQQNAGRVTDRVAPFSRHQNAAWIPNCVRRSLSLTIITHVYSQKMTKSKSTI